ncbi:hypothetical protein VTK56DRAFT_6692 [Thermocarpiscus australiensis]
MKMHLCAAAYAAYIQNIVYDHGWHLLCQALIIQQAEFFARRLCERDRFHVNGKLWGEDPIIGPARYCGAPALLVLSDFSVQLSHLFPCYLRLPAGQDNRCSVPASRASQQCAHPSQRSPSPDYTLARRSSQVSTAPSHHVRRRQTHLVARRVRLAPLVHAICRRRLLRRLVRAMQDDRAAFCATRVLALDPRLPRIRKGERRQRSIGRPEIRRRCHADIPLLQGREAGRREWRCHDTGREPAEPEPGRPESGQAGKGEGRGRCRRGRLELSRERTGLEPRTKNNVRETERQTWLGNV